MKMSALILRTRNPRTDDKSIFKLITTELIPLSATTHPGDASAIYSLPTRFRSGSTWVASEGKRKPPVAFIHCENAFGMLYIDLLAVHPEYRNRMIGSQLLSLAEQEGEKQGLSQSRLIVDHHNEKAHRFYRRSGYQMVRFIPQLLCCEYVKPLYH